MDTVVRWQAAASAPIHTDTAEVRSAEIPVLKTGTVLETGGVYLDLSHPVRGPFRALFGQVAGSGNRYVAQRDLICDVWCHLIRAAAVAAFGGLHEVDCSQLHADATLLPWPQTVTTLPESMAAP